MPVAAEAGLVERDLRLLAELKGGRAHLHVAHLSTAAALDAVRKARRNGLHVTCEVTPHHFVLTEAAVSGRVDTLQKPQAAEQYRHGHQVDIEEKQDVQRKAHDSQNPAPQEQRGRRHARHPGEGRWLR